MVGDTYHNSLNSIEPLHKLSKSGFFLCVSCSFPSAAFILIRVNCSLVCHRMGTRVFVGGLTYRVRERDLERFFRKYGRIKEIAMKNGFAFVVSFCVR